MTIGSTPVCFWPGDVELELDDDEPAEGPPAPARILVLIFMTHLSI